MSFYVVLTAVGTCFLGTWHGMRCSSFRKAAGLGYPTPYADSAQLSAASAEDKHKLYLFNCAQRAHVSDTASWWCIISITRTMLTVPSTLGNFLENHYMALTTLLIGGLHYPLLSSAFGLIWSLGRIVYAVGYTSQTKENGKGRLAGAFFWLAQLGLFVNAGLTGYSMAF
ncbi:membrane-associated proteins in eicosanoid and glutathione metabolism [Aureobasidium pullulans]|uniref:Membrane-associated proteins in eicosanoid and glutathione metabolism n=1 Tax=Aureobasidium pullulans TaxID=5580 RepID=A0A4S9LWE3_AURPU|nr:membrane-associated proteins in eicosanoid and glutathione metabolism [Aureobasidium pullulans]